MRMQFAQLCKAMRTTFEHSNVRVNWNWGGSFHWHALIMVKNGSTQNKQNMGMPLKA